MDNYNKWQSFWDMFEFVANRNIDISRIQKNSPTVYLKSWETGAAKSAII